MALLTHESRGYSTPGGLVSRTLRSLIVTATLALGLAVSSAYADEGHAHNDTNPTDGDAASATGNDDHGHEPEGGGHQHSEWLDPPEQYAGMVSDEWADADAIARGESIYRDQCVVCHGRDGRGTGPMAESLAHPPADLTHNFHTAPGEGDGYLYWRVSEGGTVEPFRSRGSKMPAFKNVLNSDERWDVLAYVHAFFHQGLAQWRPASADSRDDSGPDDT